MPTRPLVVRHVDDLALFPSVWHRRAIALATVFLLLFPFVAGPRWLTVGNLALVSTVGAAALMILTGFAGQISLGHAAFLALGAYTQAVLGKEGTPFWLAMPAAGLVAAAVGVFVGVFTLRLKGLYLAIVTLGLVFVVNHVLHALPSLSGGSSGTRVPAHAWFPGDDAPRRLSSFTDTMLLGPLRFTFERKLYFVFLGVVLLTLWAVKNLTRTPAGRAMMAVRDRDLAAASVGVNPARSKLLAFGLSSFFAGVAGAMFGLQQQYVTIEPPFDLSMSIAYIAMIVLGGIGTVFGAVAGAVAFTVLSPLAELVGSSLPLLSRLSTGQQSTVIFALVVCGFLVFEPLGLFGIWLRIQRYFAAWPFRY